MIIAGEQVKELTEEQRHKLASLEELYGFWNQQINVISRKDMDHFFVRHVLHSLSVAQVFDFKNNHTVLDLGTGGGFPGIPLSIVFPNVHFHLVDSIGKKIRVVNEVTQALKLNNVTSEHIRAEQIQDKKFDCVVSRAVAPLKELIHWSRPLINRKNAAAYGLICLKGGDLAQEIHATGRRVHVWPLYPAIFKNKWFEEKFILQVRNLK